MLDTAYTNELAKRVFSEERAIKRLDGWFLSKEICIRHEGECEKLSRAERAGYLLQRVAEELPLSISDNAVFAGTERDAFARSYALINPSFKVESFAGYCDPTAVFGDIEPNEEITSERIEAVRAHDAAGEYTRALSETYSRCERYTGEVAFFVEQVTGHVIPDMRYALKNGVLKMLTDIENKLSGEITEKQREEYAAMTYALRAALVLAERYSLIAEEKAALLSGRDSERMTKIAETLKRVPAYGAGRLYEAIQAFMILWETMCIEQAPNPFAFSVGNADRIFEPYRAAESLGREEAASLFRHFLVFFNVADRSWAISQNVLIGGRDADGNDLTNLCSYALLDAYFDTNFPQPILSVKLHKNTPEKLYRELGRFFFTPGTLTPSLFNDDQLFEVLAASGIDREELPDYSVAGCQEPLIMGRDNGNTTNSWLNLGKILELSLNDGVSAITGEKIIEAKPLSAREKLENIRELFYENLKFFVAEMAKAANDASRAVSLLPVPFLSAFMGGIESGYDMRDTEKQGTKYNGSGCLIHGNTTVADSFIAIDCLLRDRPEDAEKLLEALKHNFKGYEELRDYLVGCPKFGNNDETADAEAVKVTECAADVVRAEKNYLGNPFRPDFSTPSTHLLYGYWVGALPCGRKARDMLNYGVDPLYGDAQNGLGFRTLSTRKLPFEKMCGGYASHFGVDPVYFRAETKEEKGVEMYKKLFKPLFFNENNDKSAPFYLYMNITTPETLRKVLANPKKYAPSGVYIMRIHGTFVNFLDLSPAIQQDIITRLDLQSTSC